MDINNTTKW